MRISLSRIVASVVTAAALGITGCTAGEPSSTPVIPQTQQNFTELTHAAGRWVAADLTSFKIIHTFTMPATPRSNITASMAELDIRSQRRALQSLNYGSTQDATLAIERAAHVTEFQVASSPTVAKALIYSYDDGSKALLQQLDDNGGMRLLHPDGTHSDLNILFGTDGQGHAAVVVRSGSSQPDSSVASTLSVRRPTMLLCSFPGGRDGFVGAAGSVGGVVGNFVGSWLGSGLGGSLGFVVGFVGDPLGGQVLGTAFGLVIGARIGTAAGNLAGVFSASAMAGYVYDQFCGK